MSLPTAVQMLWWDVRVAGRTLLRNRGLSLASIATMGLAVGGLTAMLTVANAVVFRPLPFPDPNRLVALCEVHPSVAGFCVASPPDVTDWARASHSFSAIGLGRDWPFTLIQGDRTVGLHGGLATSGMFQALQVRPALGRLIEPEDVRPGNRHVALLSQAAWQTRFGGRPDVLGQSILLDDSAYTIVGVLPAGFDVPLLEGVDVWTPLPFDPADGEQRKWRGFGVYARLAPGVTAEAAGAELRDIQGRLAEQYPATNRDWGVAVRSLHGEVVGDVRPALLAFLGATALAVLIACVNVATLLLARWSGRTREVAIRSALGSSRVRLLRLLLLESLLLGSAGSLAGLLLAPWATRLFLSLAPAGIPRLDQVTVSPAMLGLAMLFGLGATLLAGLAPAVRTSGLDLATALRLAGADGGTHGRELLRRGLVVIEIALAVLLLVGAGLLGRSFVNLLRWSPGFERDHLVTVWTFLSPGRHPTQADVVATYRRMRSEVAALPGVSLVGQASAGPLFGGRETGSFKVPGGPADEGLAARWYDVGPEYFRALGLPLRRGRGIGAGDVAGTPPVAVVNESFARRMWPGGDAVGQHLLWADEGGIEMEVVGFVADVPPFRAGQPVEPEVYWPFEQQVRWAAYLVVRTAVDPATFAKLLPDRLEEAVPGVQVGRVQTMDELVERRLASPRFSVVLIGGFAVMATIIAGVGVYGVVNYLALRRRREIGIRMALGAEPGTVLRAVLWEGAALALTGALVGVAGALVAGRLIGSMLAGVSPADPLTLAAVPLLLTVVAVVAAWVPARRAVRTDPLTVLRTD
jgi:putative ABC transport system permease protein